jgi:hypothetical protein
MVVWRRHVELVEGRRALQAAERWLARKQPGPRKSTCELRDHDL